MAVRLLFPYYVFHRNLLQEDLPDGVGVNQEYMELLVRTIYDMRKKDPKGRQISNAYTGWQSNDGCDSNPAFMKLCKQIEKLFDDEVKPFHGLYKPEHNMRVVVGNMWANINDHIAWNKPHMHNGCWYSGVFYIKADGDEGRFEAMDVMPKVVSDFPSSERTGSSWGLPPTRGELVVFPSALMHMVEPNLTKKDRYSVSFNVEVKNFGKEYHGKVKNYNPDEFVFDVDTLGNPILR